MNPFEHLSFQNNITASEEQKTTPEKERRQSKYFLPPSSDNTPSQPTEINLAIQSDQSRLNWERNRALALGICDFVASEIEGISMFSVTRLARIYGHESATAFAKKWTSIKSDFQYCAEFRVFQKRGEDYISRSTFDKAVLPFLSKRLADEFVTEIRRAPLAPIIPAHTPIPLESDETTPPETHTVIPKITEVVPYKFVPPRWEISREVWTRHENILREMKRDRGCYIGQISQNEYKFGYTDKGFMTRTDKHTKDFPDFYLCFAHYCANGYEAERIFNNDPYINSHLVRVKTQKLNHREIIQVDGTLSEARMKEIYLRCITQVNEKELHNLRKTEVITGSLSEEESVEVLQETEMIPTTPELLPVVLEQQEEEPKEISLPPPSVEPTPTAQSPSPYSEAVELKKLDLAQLKENHKHEIRLRLLDQQNWIEILKAEHEMGFGQANDPAKGRKRKVIDHVCVPPLNKRSSQSRVEVYKYDHKTNQLIGKFPHLDAAVQSGKSYSKQLLTLAAKQGSIYRGFKWKFKQQP